VKPDLVVSKADAQIIVDRVVVGRTVAAIANIQGGAISALFEIAFGDDHEPLVLKVYPDDLHWKMRKEVTVSSLIQNRLTVPVPRILLADDTKSVLKFNFILMVDATYLGPRRMSLIEGTRRVSYAVLADGCDRWVAHANCYQGAGGMIGTILSSDHKPELILYLINDRRPVSDLRLPE
jgi:hygromycin-B 7''-O-kinase